MTSTAEPHPAQLWSLLAEYFLDTENLHLIPFTAYHCLDAGYTIEEVRHAWRYEVAPVLGLNLWATAGEWAGWSDRWLTERIGAHRTRHPGTGWSATLLYYLLAGIVDGVLTAITGCMAALAEVPRAQRHPMSRDLSILAGFYLGESEPSGGVAPDHEPTLRALYTDVFVPIFRPLAGRWIGHRCGDRRVRTLLANGYLSA
jgi:hypothetical protein